MKQVIHCGQLFTAVDGAVQKDMALCLNDEKIEKVCPFAEAETDGAKIIDLSDKFVMPGLIDAHVHTCADGAAGSFSGDGDTIGDVAFKSLVNAQKDLMAGFTTLRDECSNGFADVALRNAINTGKVTGPRMMVSGIAIGATGGHADSHHSPHVSEAPVNGLIIDSPDEGRKAARYNFKYGADQIKIMATGGVLSFGDDPAASELTLEEMQAILDVAKERGRTSSAHAHGANGIKYAIRAGITSIEHGMLMDDECIDLMALSGTYLIPTIIAAHQIVANGREGGMPEWAVLKAEQCLAGHKENLRKCREKGVKIGFGTDAGTNYNEHGKQALEAKLMVEYGFEPAYVLQAITRVNAEMMRWNERVGTLEAGKLADVVAFEKSPLEEIETMQNALFVMKDGVIYKE